MKHVILTNVIGKCCKLTIYWKMYKKYDDYEYVVFLNIVFIFYVKNI